MQDVGRRIEALAGPIAAAFGCDVVSVRYSRGPRRSIITVFLDLAQPEPSPGEWVRAGVPFDEAGEELPPPYPGSAVAIDTCSRASREIDAVIEAESVVSGSYVLEVSSPGLARPLVRPADYVRHRGRAIEVRTVETIGDSRFLRGRLVAVDPEGFVVVASEGAGRGEPCRVAFANVASARLVVDIPVPVKPGRRGSGMRKR